MNKWIICPTLSEKTRESILVLVMFKGTIYSQKVRKYHLCKRHLKKVLEKFISQERHNLKYFSNENKNDYQNMIY